MNNTDKSNKLIEIAKANGALFNEPERSIYFKDAGQLQATIDVVNATNTGDCIRRSDVLEVFNNLPNESVNINGIFLTAKLTHELIEEIISIPAITNYASNDVINASETIDEREVFDEWFKTTMPECFKGHTANDSDCTMQYNACLITWRARTNLSPYPNNTDAIQSTNSAIPVAFLDENKQIVIIGFDAWNKCSYVDADRAIPDAWIPVYLAPPPLQAVNNALEKVTLISILGYEDKAVFVNELKQALKDKG